MTALITNPVWKNGPKICPRAWLPAWPDFKSMMANHELFSPGTHLKRTYECPWCGCWHLESVARDVSGSSSGNGRHSKHL